VCVALRGRQGGTPHLLARLRGAGDDGAGKSAEALLEPFLGQQMQVAAGM